RRIYVHVARKRIKNFNQVTALYSGFTQPLTRIERSIPGQYGNFHPAPLCQTWSKARVSYIDVAVLARRPTLFVQIIQNKWAAFFNDCSADMIAPGIPAIIAAT